MRIGILVETSGKRWATSRSTARDEGKFEPADFAFVRASPIYDWRVAIERQQADGAAEPARQWSVRELLAAGTGEEQAWLFVSAMLNLQMQEDDDPRIRRLLGDAQARIAAIADARPVVAGQWVGMVALDDLVCGIATGLGEQITRPPRLNTTISRRS